MGNINRKTIAVLRRRQKERRDRPLQAARPETLESKPKPEPLEPPKPEPVEPVSESPESVSEEPVKKQLCVGTILCDTSELCRSWLDLQLRYLKETTDDFDHVTYISHAAKNEIMDSMDTYVLEASGDNQKKNSSAHVHGLKVLKRHFMAKKDQYKNFLFLDMDAFPIRKWQHILNKWMLHYHIATLLRCENLEQRVHSSVLYAGSAYVERLDWEVGSVGTDLIGDRESDVRLTEYQQKSRDKVFVMLRSNKCNVHPLLCGVYYDMFYHHGCGSGRNFNMRARPYWKHAIEQKFDVEGTIQSLMKDPQGYIGQLAGWCPREYAKV